MKSAAHTAVKGEYVLDNYRIITITDKRQITIPKQIYDELKLKSGKVKCYVSDGKIIIEPFQSSSFWDFSSNILKDLVAEGYQGPDLIKEFDSRRQMVKESFALMVDEAVKEIRDHQGKDADELLAEIVSELETRQEK